jgi:hypothetical protein
VDKAARAAIVRIIAAMNDQEFDSLVRDARGDPYEPSPADYRQLVTELEGQTRDKTKDAANESLRSYLQGQGD